MELREVNKDNLIEIDGKYFVDSSMKGELVKDQEFFPAWFLIKRSTQILHDYPGIGAWIYGEAKEHGVDGPYTTKKQAQEALKIARSELTDSCNDFSGKLFCKLLDKPYDPETLPVYKYCSNNIEIGNPALLDYYLKNPLAPNLPAFPREVSQEQIDILTKTLMERAKERSVEYREVERDGFKVSQAKITGKEGDVFVECGKKPAEDIDYFFLSTFSNFQDINRLWSDCVNHGIDRTWLSCAVSTLSSLNKIDISLKKDSIEQILTENEFIR